MSKEKRGKKVVQIPQTIEDADKFLCEIATEQRHIEEIELELNEGIDRLKVLAVVKAKVHQEIIQNLLGGIFIFAEHNRDVLTKAGKVKTVTTPMGVFGWRTTPPSIKFRTSVATILKTLSRMGLAKRFIRTKQEVDKTALLKNLKTARLIKGITVRQFEEFFVKPDAVDLKEIAISTEKLQKVYT